MTQLKSSTERLLEHLRAKTEADEFNEVYRSSEDDADYIIEPEQNWISGFRKAIHPKGIEWGCALVAHLRHKQSFVYWLYDDFGNTTKSYTKPNYSKPQTCHTIVIAPEDWLRGEWLDEYNNHDTRPSIEPCVKWSGLNQAILFGGPIDEIGRIPKSKQEWRECLDETMSAPSMLELGPQGASQTSLLEGNLLILLSRSEPIGSNGESFKLGGFELEQLERDPLRTAHGAVASINSWFKVFTPDAPDVVGSTEIFERAIFWENIPLCDTCFDHDVQLMSEGIKHLLPIEAKYHPSDYIPLEPARTLELETPEDHHTGIYRNDFWGELQ